MAVQTSAGASVAISAALPATFDSTGYAALTYTSIGEVTEIGEFQGEYASVTHIPLADRVVRKFKGSVNYGTLPLTMAYDSDNAGQDLLETASSDDDDYSFKITMQDGTIRYMTGQVMSFKLNVGSADSMVTATSTVEVTRKPIAA